MAIDTATFKTYAAIIVKTIASIDAKLGEAAQRYVDALVARKDGQIGDEELQAVMDTLPKASECSDEIVSLFRNLIVFSASYLAV